jgi:hypothetical protein
MDRESATTIRPDMPARWPQSPPELPRRRLAANEAERHCAIAQAVVATAFGQVALNRPGPGPDGAPKRHRATAFKRQIAMYLAHVGFGLSMAEIGRAFGRDRTTVVHACHLIEDRRDEARFDGLLDHLEQAATALRAAARINWNG